MSACSACPTSRHPAVQLGACGGSKRRITWKSGWVPLPMPCFVLCCPLIGLQGTKTQIATMANVEWQKIPGMPSTNAQSLKAPPLRVLEPVGGGGGGGGRGARGVIRLTGEIKEASFGVPCLGRVAPGSSLYSSPKAGFLVLCCYFPLDFSPTFSGVRPAGMSN